MDEKAEGGRFNISKQVGKKLEIPLFAQILQK